MKIAIYGSRRQYDYSDLLVRFLDELGARGCEVVMHRKLYTHLREIMPKALAPVRRVVDSPDFTADYAVSLGGDGTLLRTAMWLAGKPVPVVGVNTGHLGYLAALPVGCLPDLPAMLDRCGEVFRTEERGLIRVEASCIDTSRFWPYALNEVSVGQEENSSMITADVSIDGAPLARYRADGLLVCTSTGSTAYNLSIGGPIVQPTLDVRVIAPIAAHSLSMRPLVVAGESRIDIVPGGRASHVRLSLDGRSLSLETGTKISLCAAPFKLRLMHLRERSFADTLREKLRWGAEGEM